MLTSLLNIFKGALLDMRNFLATESHLKMMKNTFYKDVSV